MVGDPSRDLVPPRRYLTDPAGFGNPDVDRMWVQPVTPTAFTGMRAAEVQHHVMVEVRRRLVRTEHLWDEPMESVSAEIGFEPQRLGRLMGGHYRLGMRDLAALEGVFGPILVLLNYERAPIADESLRRRFHLDSARWGID